MRFRHGDQEAVLAVERGTLLRDIQKDLCAFFGQRFPRMKANLQVEGVVYNNFERSVYALWRQGPLYDIKNHMRV